MYCPSCGRKYDIDYWRCPNCGALLSEKPVVQEKSESMGLGIASMVLGILALFGILFLVPAWVFATVSVILGIVQLALHSKKGMAIAGIIMSIIALVLSVLWLVLILKINEEDAPNNYWREYYEENVPGMDFDLNGEKEL